MTDVDRGQPVEFTLGACLCPGSPHHPAGVVRLAPEVPLTLGVAAKVTLNAVLAQGGTFADAVGHMARVYLHHGIVGWTFMEPGPERGALVPIPATAANIDRLLPFHCGGEDVADRCDDLYSETIWRPLLATTPRSSPSSSTDGSTSAPATTPSSPTLSDELQVPSAPSSPAGTDGKPSEDPAP